MQIDPNMQYGHQFYAVPIMPFYAVPIMPGQLPSSYGGFVSQPMPQTTGGKPAAASAESATSKSSKKKKKEATATGDQKGNGNRTTQSFKESKASAQAQQNHATWLKYKTQLCRHWEMTRECSLGSMCSFAHGMHELRKISDPMPAYFPGRNNVGALFSNYKTQICRNFQETGSCKFENYCCYAHGKEQLRSLTDPIPPVPPQVMLYNPANAKVMGNGSKHVNASNSQFLTGQNVAPQEATSMEGQDATSGKVLDQNLAPFQFWGQPDGANNSLKAESTGSDDNVMPQD